MLRGLFILCIAASMVGCGTVVRGTKQGVKFQSEPAGATVTVVRAKKVKTRWTCVSPCEIQLSRKRDFDVSFELDGYKPATARLASRIGAKGGATAIPGNFVLGGGVGFIVDAGTGANMQLKPDPMRAKLASIDSTEASVVYDVRTDGGGKQDVYISPADSTAAAASSQNVAQKMKRLPRSFGAVGSPVTKSSETGRSMTEPYGVLIAKVDPEGAAARAGLKSGDVVQSMNGKRVESMADIDVIANDMASGQSAALTIWRDGERYEATLVF